MARRRPPARRPGLRRRGLARNTRVHRDAARNETSEPIEQVADFEEYTRLYRESWSEPDIRWLLSTVPTVMIFDDHDVHDDWNISWLWVEEMRRKPWWEARITGAFMAYWIYQHLGNLSPPELEEDTALPTGQSRTRTPGRCCGASRTTWDRESAASRWAFYRDFGDTRLARARLTCGARALGRPSPDDRRRRVGLDRRPLERRVRPRDHREHAAGVPAHGIHHLQAWNEALCAGAGDGSPPT